MEAGTTDRRVRRTRELLRSALLSLIQEKGYERITIRDILDRADVGRSTFYAHYRDKDELLQSGLEDVRSALAAEMQPGASRSKGAFLELTLGLFRHVEAHRHLWRPLTRKGGADLMVRVVRGSADELVRAHVRLQFPEASSDDPRYEMAIQFVVGALMGVLVWWLDSEAPLSAEEMHDAFQRFAARGVRRFLSS
jgi:AcrR family transcriptional regulator